MASIVQNPIESIYARFRSRVLEQELVTEDQMSFGSSDVGSKMPWIAFKPMTNYSWLQATDLSNNECGILINIQVECFAKKESTSMHLEDACKQIMFDMGFRSSGFAHRFKNNNVHRYISRFEMPYTGTLHDLSEQSGSQQRLSLTTNN